jgi:serine/threonine protein phosphatase PrpC
VCIMQEASQKHFESGSTATVVLIVDGKIIAANVGDSKAFLCSEGHDPHCRNRKRRRRRNPIDHEEFALENYDGPLYHARELTKDHHPDREDERSRVEAAGGYVIEWAGVHRVNGELALSRAIGDLPFKRYGVISTPELTGWQILSENDTFLVASSDGIFEKMTMQDVCDLMLHAKLRINQDLGSSAITQHNLADYVVRVALQKGTTDNVAAVVVPLGPPSSAGTTLEDWSQFEGNLKTSISPLQNIPYQLKSGSLTDHLLCLLIFIVTTP